MKNALLELVQATRRFITQDQLAPLSFSVEKSEPLPTPTLPLQVGAQKVVTNSSYKESTPPELFKPLPLQSEKLEIERAAILKLEPMQSPAQDSFDDVRKRVQTSLSNLQILNEIPDDREARTIAEGWRRRSSVPEILLLAHEESVQARALLANLAKAIALSIGRCDLISVQQIERSNRWDDYLDRSRVRLVVAPDHAIYQVQAAMDRYKEEASTSRRFLGGVPLLLLSDLPRYFHDPKRKAALWQAIRRAYG